jgi:hypothetical protein
MRRFVLCSVLMFAGLLPISFHCDAQQVSDPCAQLRSPDNVARFLAIPDARVTIASATIVSAERDIPETCTVEGQIPPNVGFLLRMPTTTWNGKFMMGGCGGPCGNYLVDRIDPALVRNYAVVTTDMGHEGSGWGFAYQNIQGEIDFGYRATHLVAAIAKVIIDAYYAKTPSHSYFWGCSTGGRQAMMEAEHFPEDFEGILAGAPPFNETEDTPLFLSWSAKANLDKNGMSILDPSKLPMIHKAVLAACDAKDGLNDGLLQDPASCSWKPQEITCKTGQSPSTCLTVQEAGVVQKIYDGASNSKGDLLYFGMARGSELQWSPAFIGPKGFSGFFYSYGNDFMANVTFYNDAGPGDSAGSFNYDRDPQRLSITERIYNAENPDLRKFKAAGGKLILYHGWNDNNIPPQASVDYYQTATRTMGGEQSTKDFFRLFMLPGVNHCRNGIGGGEVDWISALENWVEKGEAPNQVTAYHMLVEPYPTIKTGDLPNQVEGAYMQMPRHPLESTSYDRSRPVYAYPYIAHYKGTGAPEKSSNWEPVKP